MIVLAPIRVVWADELKIGMSSAFSGLAAALGTGIRQGVEARLEQVNASGGVHGHALRLIALEMVTNPAAPPPMCDN